MSDDTLSLPEGLARQDSIQDYRDYKDFSQHKNVNINGSGDFPNNSDADYQFSSSDLTDALLAGGLHVKETYHKPDVKCMCSICFNICCMFVLYF